MYLFPAAGSPLRGPVRPRSLGHARDPEDGGGGRGSVGRLFSCQGGPNQAILFGGKKSRGPYLGPPACFKGIECLLDEVSVIWVAGDIFSTPPKAEEGFGCGQC